MGLVRIRAFRLREHLKEAPADQVRLALAPEIQRRPACKDEPPVGVEDVEGLAYSFEHQPEAPLALPNGTLRLAEPVRILLRVDPPGDVAPGEELIDRPPRLVLERAEEQACDEAGAVLPVLNGFEMFVAVLLERLAETLGVLGISVGAIHEERLLAQHFFHAVAG